MGVVASTLRQEELEGVRSWWQRVAHFLQQLRKIARLVWQTAELLQLGHHNQLDQQEHHNLKQERQEVHHKMVPVEHHMTEH